ncbi:MAG: fibronectin type III domain-containing protein [Kiritimatiellae bacterium]|nr:fibronectin type III domain-containing protein [Kiritimatiellia bacterium]
MNYKSIHAAMRTALVAVATTTASLIAAVAASAAEAPTGLAVAAIDYTQASCNIDCSARLSWTAPAGSPTAYNVYRRIAANENPTLAGTVAAPTTTFTDTTATVGQTYLYTVTAVDAGGESAESASVSYRKVANVATKANGAWTNSGTLTTWGGMSLANLNDGDVATAARLEGWGGFFYTFSGSKPYVSCVRVYASNAYSSSTSQTLYGLRDSNSDRVDVRNPSATPAAETFASGAWTPYTVHDSFADTTWYGFLWGGSSQYPMLCELEAYGYFSASLLGAPSSLAVEVVDNEVALSWTAGANAASYKVYRKPDGGAWTTVTSGLSGCSYTDTTAERGNTYIYRIAAVSANGDELSSSERSAYLPAGAQVWWNFPNVKSIAYPGAAAWPANPRPHFLSRDRAGTILLAAMSTDDGRLPVMTFDMEALADGDGELLSRETDAKSWWIYGDNAYVPWQDKGFCWKGAAATTDLIFWANGTANGNAVAVVRRADDSEDVFTTLDAEGRTFNFFMNGGLESSADGNYLYSNCGADGEKNKIFKFAINRNDKTLRVVATNTVAGIDTIRNFAVYTVSGSEIAVFGEGESAGGALGVLDLSTGSSTLMSAPAITGKIMNVKLADTTDGLYLVAQNEDGLVAVYDFDAANKTIAFEKTIPAATMKALYGASGSFECRNLEMTADGRYAFVLCNGGPDTRLTVIGATIKTVPEEAPLSLTANANMDSLWQAKLEWANASGVTATGIRVLRAQTGKAGYATVADLPLGTTEYTDTSAVGGVAYTYAVAYINSFEGTTVAGPVATATCTPWQSLMPYKAQVISTKFNGNSYLTEYAKAFDGSLSTECGSGFYGPVFGLQFTEPVIFGASRISAIAWAASDTYHRLDGMKLSGGGHDSITLSGGDITAYSGLTQLAQAGSPRGNDWFALDSGDTSQSWEFLVFSKSGEWYGEFREAEFYGAVASLKAEAESKDSEAAASVAPVLSASAGTLSWANEPNETVAVVFYRARMAEGPYALVAEVAPGVGTFTDADASTGVEYHYRAAYVTEYHGVNLEGVLSDAVANTKPAAVQSVLLTENGAAAKTYGYAVKRAGGVPLSDAEKAFDGSTSTFPIWYEQAAGWGKNLYIGYNFNEPVKITKAKVVAYKNENNTWNRVSLRVSPDLAYLQNPGDTSYLFPNSNSDALSWGGAFNPTACTVLKTFDGTVTDGQVWEQDGLSTDWTRCAYLWGMAYDTWYASVREFELWGYTESMWEAAQPRTVVQPVENVAARMDDETLTLTWALANDAATAITVKHRVCGGAWDVVATLAGDATTIVTDAVEIGRYNEYRFEVSDGSETVWAASDFAVCPLLNKGTRTAIGCTSTAAWDYITADSGTSFTATFSLAGSSATSLGLTAGTGSGKTVNLYIRKTLDATPAVNVQRHWVYGNTIGFYAYDAAAAQSGSNYVIPWTAEGNASTRFKFVKSDKTYQLMTAADGGAWTEATSYTFVGDDPLGRGPFLVGVHIGDPNLATLPQIQPVALRVNCQTATQIVVR